MTRVIDPYTAQTSTQDRGLRRYDIPEGPLETAIAAYQSASGVTVTFPADIPPRNAPHHQEACHRLDWELHGLISARCGNPILRKQIEGLNDLVQLVRFRVGEGHGALEAALRAHLRIIEALQEGNPAAARMRMAEHIRESADAAARWN